MVWDIAGYIGSALLLISFFMVTRGQWSPKSYYYLFANLIGAGLLAFYQIRLGAYAGVFLNIIFILVAISGILAAFWPKNNKKS
jgi:hypothetical protein